MNRGDGGGTGGGTPFGFVSNSGPINNYGNGFVPHKHTIQQQQQQQQHQLNEHNVLTQGTSVDEIRNAEPTTSEMLDSNRNESQIGIETTSGGMVTNEQVQDVSNQNQGQGDPDEQSQNRTNGIMEEHHRSRTIITCQTPDSSENEESTTDRQPAGFTVC